MHTNRKNADQVVYKATTKDHRKVEYIGSTAGDFKVTFINHKASFKNEDKNSPLTICLGKWPKQKQKERLRTPGPEAGNIERMPSL